MIVRALVLPALLLAASAQAQTVLLRYHPPVGKTVSYTMKMSMTMATPQAPGGKPMHFDQNVPMTLKVVSHTADTTTVEMTTGASGMMKANTTRLTLDQYGTPKGAGGSGPGAAMMSSMGQGSQGISFPKGPVKVGATWTSSIDLGKMGGGMPGGMKMNGKVPIVYRLTGLRGGVATILMTAKGTMSMNMSGKAMNISMDIRSTSDIDSATGLAKSSVTTTDTTTAIPGAGTMRQHMTMTMK